MHRYPVLLIASVLVILIAGVASWNVSGAFQDVPPEDFPDPTSAVLPPVVSEDEWYKYDSAWSEKLAPEITYSEPIPLSGIETLGGIVHVEGVTVTLPADVYVSNFEISRSCIEDPLKICHITPVYGLSRVESVGSVQKWGGGELALGGSEARAWYYATVNPDERTEVHDVYIEFVNSIGIETIEDAGYMDPDPAAWATPVDDPTPMPTPGPEGVTIEKS